MTRGRVRPTKRTGNSLQHAAPARSVDGRFRAVPDPNNTGAVDASPTIAPGSAANRAMRSDVVQPGRVSSDHPARMRVLLVIVLAFATATSLAEPDARPAGPQADERAVAETLRLLGPGFTRHETRHFVVLSDTDLSWTRVRATLLERTRDQYFRVARQLAVPVVEHEHKLVCVLFDDPGRYAAFARAQDGLAAGWVAGYYATAANRVVFYNDENAPGLRRALERLEEYEAEAEARRVRAREAEGADRAFARRLLASADDLERRIDEERARLSDHAGDVAIAKTVHEAVHLLAFNTGLQSPDRDYPFWLSEGLAASFETVTPNAAFGPAHPSATRDARLADRSADWMPLADLVARTSAPAEDADVAEAMYDQSYALFTYLYRYERDALGDYIRAFGDLAPGPVPARRQLELFERHFGDPRRLDRRLRAAIAP